MAAHKRLSTISGHLQPSLSHGGKYRQSLLDNLRQASIVQLHVCTLAIPREVISKLLIGLREMVYLIIRVKENFFKSRFVFDSMSNLVRSSFDVYCREVSNPQSR